MPMTLIPPRLESELSMIENAQLIRRVEEQAGEPTFSFKHALVQDTAYASLLKQDRQALHRLVGQTLEQMYPEQKDTFAPLLAHHFDLAGGYQEALDNYSAMGEWAARHESAAVGLEALLARSTLHATFTPVYDPERGRALAEQA